MTHQYGKYERLFQYYYYYDYDYISNHFPVAPVCHRSSNSSPRKKSIMSTETLAVAISQELSETPYACSSLTPLSGGTANFVYRALLSHPLPDGTTSVIVKHSEAFVASNREFKLPAERCVGVPRF